MRVMERFEFDLLNKNTVLEFHGREIPWWNDLCDGDKPFIRNGWMRVSEAPGIGVELNDKVAKSLLWPGDTYFD